MLKMKRSEFNDPIDETTGVSEASSMDSDTESYNDIPLLDVVVKVKRDFHPMTPSKKVLSLIHI